MRLDRESPWYLVWVAVSTAIVATAIYLVVNSGEIDWLFVVLLPIAAVVGTVIGTRIKRNRRS